MDEMEIASIPAKDAIILWNMDYGQANGRISEVFVCRHDEQPAWGRRLGCSRGACDFDWLSGAWHTTPMGLFLHMLNKPGFVSDDVKIAALKEFAKIGGQDWAIALLRDLGEHVATE